MSFYELDWDLLLDYTFQEARTPYGQDRIAELAQGDLQHSGFAQSKERAQELQQETAEVLPLIEKEALWGPLRGTQEVYPYLETLRKGGILEAHAVSALRAWVNVFDSWISFPKEHCGQYFKQAITKLYEPHEFLRTVNRVITPTGELSDQASPKLLALSTTIHQLKIQISSRMEQLMRDYAAKNVLQEKYTDVREGRYVLPVKVSDQSKVDGRITESSVSKQTVFIEPKEIENLQNELRKNEAERTEEVFRILAELSYKIAPDADSIEASVMIVSYWDSVQAKARVALKYGGKPIIVTEKTFILENTVNPVLFWSLPDQQMVRNTIELKDSKKMILLSGPNTGGKTVLLKTMGLAALAARSGFFYPALSGKLEVPFFNALLIDLGDPQSIEEHVSSFSGHVFKMKHVLEVLQELKPHESALVLVDEMNSATDPEEGAALSKAFIKKVLLKDSVMMVATTHDPQLKALGVDSSNEISPLILSASILFDEETLKPTYKVIFGSPGRSRAIETAIRLGLDHEVTEQAKKYLSREHKGFESVLEQLQREYATLERAKKDALRLQEEAQKIKLEYEEKASRLVQESIEKAKQKLKHVLEMAQMEIRETVKKLQSSKSHKAIDESRHDLNESFLQAQQRIDSAVFEAAPELANLKSIDPSGDAQPTPQPHAQEFKQGMWIRSPKWKNVGEILEWDGKRAKVALGIQASQGMGRAFVVYLYPIEMEKLSAQEHQRVMSAQGGTKLHQQGLESVTVRSESVSGVPNQMDVRGQRLDEALKQVSQYLDHAFRSGKSEVLIIHGLGTGALREGIRELVKNTAYVSYYADGGTTGSTQVRF